MIVYAYNSSTGKTETGRWLGSLARQPSLLGEFKVSEKKWRQHPRNFLWPPYAPTHRHHTNMNEQNTHQQKRTMDKVTFMSFYFK